MVELANRYDALRSPFCKGYKPR